MLARWLSVTRRRRLRCSSSRAAIAWARSAASRARRELAWRHTATITAATSAMASSSPISRPVRRDCAGPSASARCTS